MTSLTTIGVIIPAGGSGNRFGGDLPKQYLPIDGVPSIIRSIRTALQVEGCSAIVVAAGLEYHTLIHELLSSCNCVDNRIHLIEGGSERQDSVSKALQHHELDGVEIIVVHDAVRPLASLALWNRVIEGARVSRAAIPVVMVADTIKRVDGDVVIETVGREHLRRVQTPQAFAREFLRRAYQQAYLDGWTGTDCASLCELTGVAVHCVAGEEHNIKITTPFDVTVASAFLARN